MENDSECVQCSEARVIGPHLPIPRWSIRALLFYLQEIIEQLYKVDVGRKTKETTES